MIFGECQELCLFYLLVLLCVYRTLNSQMDSFWKHVIVWIVWPFLYMKMLTTQISLKQIPLNLDQPPPLNVFFLHLFYDNITFRHLSYYKIEGHFFRTGHRIAPKFCTHVRIDTLTLKQIKMLTHPTPGGFRGLYIFKNLSRRTAPKFGTHVRIDTLTLKKIDPPHPRGG